MHEIGHTLPRYTNRRPAEKPFTTVILSENRRLLRAIPPLLTPADPLARLRQPTD
jgi:hypothetical protein